jgi:hypothetical protein
MRMINFKAILKTAVQGATVLLIAAGLANAQQVINLTAAPTNTTLPDGSLVPMWGYSCGAAVTGSTATCAALNPNAGTAAVITPATKAWSPFVITIPTGAAGGLQINLTNNLTVPTSMIIVGQVGGGLGTSRTTTQSPTHATQGTTWPVANSGPTFVPPPQGPRVQSLATEVAANAGTPATVSLTWAYLKPGTYLIESGTHPSIQVPMGLYGVLVVTDVPKTGTTALTTSQGCAYGYVPAATALGKATCAVSYDAEIPMAFGEIDPLQNTEVAAAVATNGFSETRVWTAACGAANTCYPPTVNYTPTYYTVNGVPFSTTQSGNSLFPVTPNTVTPASGTGSVLVRMVNAGSRMHVPAIVGSQVAGATGATNPIVTGFNVVAEDGNPLPGVPKIKSEVFMAAGKVYDVTINAQSTSGTTVTPYANALAIYDRELSLSGNKNERDAGMLAYISINGKGIAASNGGAPIATAVARADTYNALVPGQSLTVSDPSKGVIANDSYVYGVSLLSQAANGTVALASNGTFTYTPNAGSTATSDSFTYCANASVIPPPIAGTPGTCSSALSATVTLGATTISDSGITCSATSFTSTMATYLAIKTPGVLAGCVDSANLPITVVPSSVAVTGVGTVMADANGGFTATSAGSSLTFTFTAKDTLGKTGTGSATLTFPTGSGLTVNVLDGYDKTTQITDYRWVIEEDRTFYVNPACAPSVAAGGSPLAGTCPTTVSGIAPTLGTNFHTSYMPFVAQGCTGPLSCEGGQTQLGQPVVCDVGNGFCRPDSTGNGMTVVMPGSVALDPTKRYYISVLPGDAANPFINGATSAPVCASTSANVSIPNKTCGHGMGGAPISANQKSVTILTQPSPFPPGKLSVFVFEDDFPLNGEADGGGGVDVLSPQEPGLGGFQLHLWDAMGGNGDFTGQMTYDMFNQPLTNSLAGTKDPSTGEDACPIGVNQLSATTGSATTTLNTDPTATGITGMIVTCPKYEADGVTLSPLAGQAIVANLMPGRWGVVATPGADRIARGEEWLQTNTLDGQKAHDVFTRIGEPSYFQEYGPASYHVSIGFANPAIINARHDYICNGTDPVSPQPGVGYACNNTITGKVTGEHLSRTPDERLYSTGSHDTYYWTQCYASFGDPDGEDFAFTKCASDGTFTLSGLPAGNWRLTIFDQWNDLLVDGLSTPVGINPATPGTATTVNLGDVASTQWQTDLYTRTFIDDNKDGLSQAGEAGIPFANVAVRLRDGSLENLLVTDFNGTANFNETFPLFSWYTVETDVTRYKNTGTHVVYDVGGPVDGSTSCGVSGYPPCGTNKVGASHITNYLANTAETISVPTNLRVPGSVYCADADCSTHSGGGTSGIQWAAGTTPAGTNPSDPPSACTTGPASTTNPLPVTTCSTQLSSGRIDNPWTGGVEGWQGFPGQNSFLEFGKEPYVAGENGGIKGHVIYASTRPFDDPTMLVQTQWEPLVPHVTINLYQEGFASDNVTPTLTLVDTTQTSSFDDYAQGFRADGVTPNMNCPGQASNTGVTPDLFFYSLYDQPQYLSFYNSQHGGPAPTSLPNNAQFKCYDGMHNWNQLQPAPYDGMYQFPSVTSIDPVTGKPNGTNCTICQAKGTQVATALPSSDLYYGQPQLPTGKYVVEVVVPAGYELVKEEDKNILIGDNYIAPATQEFGALGNIFIIPDQASVASQQYPGPGYNSNNAQNPTNSLGTTPLEGIVPGFIPEPIWPCVGEMRIVPDYISLFPQSSQVAPFAGASRPLCDRKEVALGDQVGAIAKFYIYTSTHIAAKFTGGITDDYTSEFDPFSPQFGEKFAPPDLPVSIKDWNGNEISRVYADHWGSYDGMTYSTWEVNPPNPTGYSPTMMILCMNDPGPIPDPNNPGALITDPAFTPGYSQFCYELPFMPGTTQYLDTPVVPTSAFAGAGYNNVDCAYPNLTPAIAEVDGDGVGPWVSAAGHTLTIKALGDQMVPNYAYSGPSATTAPFNTKTIKRHYGFGTTSGTVTIGGVTAAVPAGGWSDTSITVTVPATGTGTGKIPPCTVQQQAQYGGSQAFCGQLVITAANGKQSIDTVNVTVGGKAPIHIAASASVQNAIDFASPGDLLIIDPTCNAATGAVSCETSPTSTAKNPAVTSTTNSSHSELLIMWKPVRLQGVGGPSSVISANTQPAGKLDPWRQRVACLFGLSLQGTPVTSANPYDPTNAISCGSTSGKTWTGFSEPLNYVVAGSPTQMQNAQVDPLPLEAIVGWDATQNGNLAQLLQEPTLMGALEGAGITVVAKGVNFPIPLNDPSAVAGGTLGSFPTGTTPLTGPVSLGGGLTTGDSNSLCHTSKKDTTNPFPSNFVCNPSSIDGVSITQSSQGGGGIYVHGWAHNLQIANNHIYSNAGTLSGGINLGQGEFAPSYLQGSTTNEFPGSCVTTGSIPAGGQLPYCNNLNVNIHNNDISLNSSTGDELFSGTPAGAGGISICTGSDYYKFNYNWVCGNLSSGDGGGVGHLGVSFNGDIEHNSILFNQSLNPTVPANGGGLLLMGTPDADPTCGATTDQDCVSNPALTTPSDGIGPNLVVNANLIMGNAAESGSGGGIRMQNVNGSDVIAFPTTPSQWWQPTITNNIIVDNVAGWDGGGVSMLDALNTNFAHNTVAANTTTASAGILFTALGAPLASAPSNGAENCYNGASGSGAQTSCPQVAGLVSIQNSSIFEANLPGPIVCPINHSAVGTGTAFYTGRGRNQTLVGYQNGSCSTFSYPYLVDNLFYQNSAYYIGVGSLSNQYQQNVVTLYQAGTKTMAPTQTSTGQCQPVSYWDIGVRGDKAPGSHDSGVTLSLTYSNLTNSAENGLGSNYSNANPAFFSQYCDGARTPPEFQQSGFAVPPGISDATVPNPIFNLTPVATVDEGNNWINLRWGPLSLVQPPATGTTTEGGMLGNYGLGTGSPVAASIPNTYFTGTVEPAVGATLNFDFYGNPRPSTKNGAVSIGAVQYTPPSFAVLAVTPSPLPAFPSTVVGVASAAQTLTLSNSGGATATGITVTVTAPFSQTGGTCGTTLAAGTTCTINVVFTPTAPGAATGTATIAASVAVNNSPVTLTGTGTAAIKSATLTPLTWNPTAKRGVGKGTIQCIFGGGPCQTFTLKNTGNVPLTGITQGVLGGTSAADFALNGLFTTCGPNGVLGPDTTLAVGATCTIEVQFAPLSTETANTDVATISVTDSAGTQSSALSGTATGPVLASISPTSGARSSTVPVILTGNDLVLTGSTTKVSVSGSGVACTVTGTPTATTVNASCVISSSAGTGNHNVTVVVSGTNGGTSNAVVFSVH